MRDDHGPTPQWQERAPADSLFAEFNERSLARAYSLAGYLLGDAGDAEDATQEALARAWEARGTLRDGSLFERWLDRILVNVCLDRSRRRRVIRFIPMDSAEELAGIDPFKDYAVRDDVGRALQKLSPEHRVVVVLRFWADLQVDEIARRIGCPSGTVKSRLHTAMAALRAELRRQA